MAQPDALDELMAIEAIKQLKARFFRCIDEKRWGEFAEVFAEDAVLERPDGPVQGRAAIVALVSGHIGTARTVHVGWLPEIRLTGVDCAVGVWGMTDHIEHATEAEPVGLVGYGRHHDEYIFEDGEWRISKMRLVRLRVDPLPGGFPPGYGTGAAARTASTARRRDAEASIRRPR